MNRHFGEITMNHQENKKQNNIINDKTDANKDSNEDTEELVIEGMDGVGYMNPSISVESRF